MMDATRLTLRYDHAARGWGDKMRTLGYADAYRGFLADGVRASAAEYVCDVGCGTGAFAEGWLEMYGPAARLTLLDPSRAMLERAESALARHGGRAGSVQAGIADFMPDAPFDHLLVAHVLEHVPDPAAALRRLRGWVRPGGQLHLVASKPHWCNAIIWLRWQHRTFRTAEIQALLDHSGWRLDAAYAFPSGPPSRTSRGYRATAV